MYCPKCATKNIEEAKYCQECGNKLQTTSTSVSDGLIKTVEGVKGSRLELYDYRIRLIPKKFEIKYRADYLIEDIISVDFTIPRKFKHLIGKMVPGYINFNVKGINHPDTRALMTLGGSGVNVGMYGGGKKPLLTIHFNKEQTLEFKEMKELIESKMRKYH